MYLIRKTGLATVKYIYGPSTVNVDNDNVIGSSITAGRVEAGIGIDRLTTIIMPMKGSLIFSTDLRTTLTLSQPHMKVTHHNYDRVA